MKVVFIILSLLLFIPQNSLSQQKVESDIEIALQNAKKGVYWALSNIQDKKTKIEKSIIGDDKLIAKVKLEKQINGVKVESTGYYQTNEVTIMIYRSNDSLVKEGYIINNDEEAETDK